MLASFPYLPDDLRTSVALSIKIQPDSVFSNEHYVLHAMPSEPDPTRRLS